MQFYASFWLREWSEVLRGNPGAFPGGGAGPGFAGAFDQNALQLFAGGGLDPDQVTLHDVTDRCAGSCRH